MGLHTLCWGLIPQQFALIAQRKLSLRELFGEHVVTIIKPVTSSALPNDKLHINKSYLVIRVIYDRVPLLIRFYQSLTMLDRTIRPAYVC